MANVKVNSSLAETAGIFAGDGTLYKTNCTGYVLEIRGNYDEETYYKNFVMPLFEKNLKTKLKIIDRSCKGSKIIGIRKCGKLVLSVFHDLLGFPVGSKERIVSIPKMFINNKNLYIPYLRGVFDTDGSVSIREVKKGCIQPYVSFTSVSENHRKQIHKLLKKMGFNAWKEKHRVRICGWSTVSRFFDLIEPHNDLKVNRWNRILELKMKAQVA